MSLIKQLQAQARRRTLLNLVTTNQQKPRKFEAKAGTDEATVYVYDVIDEYFGVGARQFAEALGQINAKTIHLRINSPGGDVFAARAMATIVAQHPAKVIAHVDGLAASAASYLALAADEVEIADGAFFMIHKAWTLAMGNADDLKTTAALLEQIDAELVADYVRQTGATEDKVRGWMADETWFNADESVEAGFADRKAETKAKNQSSWDLSAYERAPAALAVPAEPEPDTEDDSERQHAAAARHFAVIRDRIA